MHASGPEWNLDKGFHILNCLPSIKAWYVLTRRISHRFSNSISLSQVHPSSVIVNKDSPYSPNWLFNQPQSAFRHITRPSPISVSSAIRKGVLRIPFGTREQKSHIQKFDGNLSFIRRRGRSSLRNQREWWLFFLICLLDYLHCRWAESNNTRALQLNKSTGTGASSHRGISEGQKKNGQSWDAK